MPLMHNHALAKTWSTLFGVGLNVIPVSRPTVLDGVGSAERLCQMIVQMEFKRVTLITDEVLLELGLCDPLKACLEDAGIAVDVFSGVVPDPPFEVVEAGAAQMRSHRTDAVLAVGGGSTLDAAKAMSIAVTNTKAIRDMAGLLRVRQVGLPLFAVPTTAGTGSEVTAVTVVSDAQAKQKRVYIDPKLVPFAAALDASLMTGIPKHITAPTGMDALTHAVEAFISDWANDETRRYSISATKMVFSNLKRAYDDGSDLEARGAMALASHFAGLAFGRAGVGYVHAISHQLGARYHVPHGLGNAVVLPRVLRFSEDVARDRLAILGRAIGVADASASDESASFAFIEAVEALKESVGIPRHLEQIQPADIEEMASLALTEAHSTYAVPKHMVMAECRAIFEELAG